MSLLGRHHSRPAASLPPCMGCMGGKRQQGLLLDPTCTARMPTHGCGGRNHQLGCRWRDRAGVLAFERPSRAHAAIGEGLKVAALQGAHGDDP
jgi:hypothetical protein